MSYSPWLHLAITFGSGVALIVLSALALDQPTIWELSFACAVFVLANAIEWLFHRDFMHRPLKLMMTIYKSHAEAHHLTYSSDDMAIKNMRDLRIVLLKAWALPAIVLSVCPAAAALWYFGQRNLGAMFVLATAAYVLAYELLHLVYHLPHRSRFFRALARHHALHHDPRLMRRWNFNVTLPLFDTLLGTRLRSIEETHIREP